MQLHVKTCAIAGISEKTLLAAEEEIENLAYTRFVLDAGLSGDFLDLLAALAPCVLGYGEIGAWLGDAATDGAYAEWIDAYAASDYQAPCLSVGQLIDRAPGAPHGVTPAASPHWADLFRPFRTAKRRAAAFWVIGLRADRLVRCGLEACAPP